jgi:hypothetical protein
MKKKLGSLYPICLKHYDSNWPMLFKEEKKNYRVFSVKNCQLNI